jgi:hypothetical protein
MKIYTNTFFRNFQFLMRIGIRMLEMYRLCIFCQFVEFTNNQFKNKFPVITLLSNNIANGEKIQGPRETVTSLCKIANIY